MSYLVSEDAIDARCASMPGLGRVQAYYFLAAEARIRADQRRNGGSYRFRGNTACSA